MPARSANDPPSLTECQCILVVEDDADIRDALREMLGMEGYRVETAGNGLEGLEKLRCENPPCLILLDIMMPVMNGLEFIAASQQSVAVARIPILFVTAYEKTAQQHSARVAGVVKKPIDVETLLGMVAKFCGPPADVTGTSAPR